MLAPIKIIVARHMPTPANEGEERLRGQGNDKIDADKAEDLAPQMAKVFDAEGVDCIYCSDLPRGIGTAKAIKADMKNDTDITPRKQMRTWDVGKFTGELRDDVWKQIEKYIKNPEIRVPGDERFDGESFDSFVSRWRREIMYQIKDAADDEHNAWIVHGNQFWTLVPLLEGRDPTMEDHDSPSPGSIFCLTLEPDKFTLTPIFESETQHKASLVS